MRIDEAMARAGEELQKVSDSPRIEAEVLLARALNVARSYLYGHPEDVLDDAAIERFLGAVTRRVGGVPLAYITGEKEFWSLNLMVGPATLIPRPETELLVELALRDIPRRSELRVLDLGTGSGAIALAIASERPNCRIMAVDIDPEALAIARENARQLEIANVAFLQGDWTAPVTDMRFDIIVANPPYVMAEDPALEALRHEPADALAAGADGLDALRILARDCGTILAPGGLLMLEHGIDQKNAVSALLLAQGWTEVTCFDDLTGRPRVTRARSAG